MAKTSNDLRNSVNVSLSPINPDMAIHDFPEKYNGDITALQNKINELVNLINVQNQVIRNLEADCIRMYNKYYSEVVNNLDQFYVKKTQN